MDFMGFDIIDGKQPLNRSNLQSQQQNRPVTPRPVNQASDALNQSAINGDGNQSVLSHNSIIKSPIDSANPGLESTLQKKPIAGQNGI